MCVCVCVCVCVQVPPKKQHPATSYPPKNVCDRARSLLNDRTTLLSNEAVAPPNFLGPLVAGCCFFFFACGTHIRFGWVRVDGQ